MYKDPIECYEAIGGALSDSATKEWDRIVVEATLDGIRIDAVVTCTKGGQVVEYLTAVPELADNVYDLARLVSTEEKGFFKKLVFTLESSGKFNVDFSY